MEALQNWIGKSETRLDVITAAPVAGLSACLDHDHSLAVGGDPLPPCWHWLCFLDTVAASGLGPDGHPARGGFLPPVSLPRRMWAGSRVTFHAPLHVGDEIRRESTIADIRQKKGRSGELVFLTLQHKIYSAGSLAIEEEQDLVYRGKGGAAPATVDAPATAQWSREFIPSPVLLFRYSALTFNGHRIHYDRDYATGVEGYESLVVQGPLTATLLLDLLHRHIPESELVAFEFRAMAPLLEGAPMRLHGRSDGSVAELWALDKSGAMAMAASAKLR